MKKTLSLLALFIIMNLPMSCDDCGRSGPRYGRIDQLSIDPGSYTSSFSSELSSNWQQAAWAVSINYLRSSQQPTTQSLFITPSFACSPIEPASNSIITNIQITAANTLIINNRTYEAGSLLNDNFKLSNLGLSVTEFVEQHKDTIDLFRYYGDLLVFQLTTPPAETADTFITIKFDFDNAESIILEARLFIEI